MALGGLRCGVGWGGGRLQGLDAPGAEGAAIVSIPSGETHFHNLADTFILFQESSLP